jgi:group II intron reverse transcriptase/maturase
MSEIPSDTAESQNLSMRGNSRRENIEIPAASQMTFYDIWERSENASGGNADVYAAGKSHNSIVPTTTSNNDGTEPSAETDEGRELAERNIDPSNLAQAQTWKPKSKGLIGVRESALRDRQLRFTNLMHHISPQLLMESFNSLKRGSAAGVDGVTWHDYEVDVEARINELHSRIHRGAYRALPSRRVWIDKANGGKRPLSVAALEDKIVQQAVLCVIQKIYEADFADFSYGFRPGRGCHQALDALSVALTTRKVNWVLDVDLAKFFDSLDREWLCKFLDLRIGDRRMIRLIRKWLNAGVVEDGNWSATAEGTPQGSVISPILANIFLHYALDLWVHWWRQQPGRGEVIIVRYADDFVMGFQHRSDAIEFQRDLEARFAKFGLEVNRDKTHLIEFGRFAEANRRRRNEPKPETFDFLGFTHISGRTRNGKYIVKRQSIGKRLRAKLQDVGTKLRSMRHAPLRTTGEWLKHVIRGWYGYHAVPGNMKRLEQFSDGIKVLWLNVLRRRSQRSHWTWERFDRVLGHYFPAPSILHPYPSARHHDRLRARTV